MALEDLKHAQRERLEYLDQCLTWRGMANRRDLVERFGISSAQAALDFRLYLERAGECAPVYDSRRKTYLADLGHRPLTPPNREAMTELLLGQLTTSPTDSLPSLERNTDPAVIARLYRAMKSGMAVRVRYVSMTTGEGEAQWIAPARFASDGERLHLRAYSFNHNDYRDYLPIRIAAESDFACRELDAPLPHDEDWHTIARIHLRPRIGLSDAQAAMIRREYGFVGETMRVETRKALEFYASRRWGLDQAGARLEIARVEHEPLGEA